MIKLFILLLSFSMVHCRAEAQLGNVDSITRMQTLLRNGGKLISGTLISCTQKKDKRFDMQVRLADGSIKKYMINTPVRKLEGYRRGVARQKITIVFSEYQNPFTHGIENVVQDAWFTGKADK